MSSTDGVIAEPQYYFMLRTHRTNIMYVAHGKVKTPSNFFTFSGQGYIPCHVDDDLTAYFSRAGLEIVATVVPFQI